MPPDACSFATTERTDKCSRTVVSSQPMIRPPPSNSQRDCSSFSRQGDFAHGRFCASLSPNYRRAGHGERGTPVLTKHRHEEDCDCQRTDCESHNRLTRRQHHDCSSGAGPMHELCSFVCSRVRQAVRAKRLTFANVAVFVGGLNDERICFEIPKRKH
jgi:hypothetical protein